MTEIQHCRRLVTDIRKQECSNETDYPVCFECLKILRKVVADLGEMAGELETQIVKQDVGAKSLGGRTDEPPLPFDPHSSEVLGGIDTVLSHYFGMYAPRKAHRDIQGLTRDRRVHTLIKWHLRNYVYTGRRDTGPGMLADFDLALQKANRAVDRKHSKIWIGTCDCGLAVMAFPKQAQFVECDCGKTYDPQQSRRELRILGGQQIVTPAQAEKLGEIWGHQLKRSTIQKWRQRGKIECHNDPCEDCNPHRYRLSDLLAAHRET